MPWYLFFKALVLLKIYFSLHRCLSRCPKFFVNTHSIYLLLAIHVIFSNELNAALLKQGICLPLSSYLLSQFSKLMIKPITQSRLNHYIEL